MHSETDFYDRTMSPTPAKPRPAPAARDSVDFILGDWAVQRPDLDFSPVGIVTRLERVRAHLESSLLGFFARYGLTAADFRVVVGLRRAGAPYRMSQSSLMAQLELTSGTVSVRLDRLSKAGIIAREPDPDDRRGSLVTLTDRGTRLFDEMAPAHLANEDLLLSALSAEERDTLADLLRRLLLPFEHERLPIGGQFGVRLEPAYIARQRRAAVGLSDTPGLLVAEADEQAQAAGLRRGDLLVAAEGTPLRSEVTLAEAIRAAGRDGAVEFDVLRGEEIRRVRLIPTDQAYSHQPADG